MVIYERITFLIVAGTLGIFLLAFALGVWGAILTLYPNSAKALSKAVHRIITDARSAYAQGREFAVHTYALSRARLQTRS